MSVLDLVSDLVAATPGNANVAPTPGERGERGEKPRQQRNQAGANSGRTGANFGKDAQKIAPIRPGFARSQTQQPCGDSPHSPLSPDLPVQTHSSHTVDVDILPTECHQHRATIWRIVTPNVDVHVITGTPITEREAREGYPDALSCVALDPPDPARLEAAPQPTLRASPEERIRCRQCDELSSTGQCRAARRGELPTTARIYAPDIEILHRCLSFVPRPGAKDRRTGAQRWPRMARRLRAAQAQENAA